MKSFTRKVLQTAATLGVGVGTVMQTAHAALPDGAATAITAYQTDVVAAVGLVIAAGIAIFGVKKLGQKMGWL